MFSIRSFGVKYNLPNRKKKRGKIVDLKAGPERLSGRLFRLVAIVFGNGGRHRGRRGGLRCCGALRRRRGLRLGVADQLVDVAADAFAGQQLTVLLGVLAAHRRTPAEAACFNVPFLIETRQILNIVAVPFFSLAIQP